MVGEKARVSDWYMTFMYDMKDRSVEVLSLPMLKKENNILSQIVFVGINYLGSNGMATVTVEGARPATGKLKMGSNNFEFAVPAVDREMRITVNVTIDGKPVNPMQTVLKPVKMKTVYLLPHSHHDIGYTDLQTNILKKQVKNLNDALDLIRKNDSYPPEARFKWNVEVLWSVEAFLESATPEKQQEFIDAVKRGDIGLQGTYLNMLTGIMRPEEQFRLLGYARKLQEKYGLVINSAMITDVPGLSWNMVPVLAQSGIKYFSDGPNGPYTGGDRVGPSNHNWADRPFYWTSPSGKEKILFWMTGFGYGSLFKGVSLQNPSRSEYLKSLQNYFNWLDEISYPYEIIHMRHTVNGDNGTVDPDLCGDVKSWNEQYVSPKFVVATSEQMFTDFEKRYGSIIPSFSGDFTPFWEDGASSTAFELGLTRRASEKLTQAEALFALVAPEKYDSAKFYQAWKNVLLFDEHTWGAWNSTQQPDSPSVIAQWKIKEKFAMDASGRADELMASLTAGQVAVADTAWFDVINTQSWTRTDLAIIPASQSRQSGRVYDDSGAEAVSQRLTNGDLVFLARDIPPLGARRYRLVKGSAGGASRFLVTGNTLSDGLITLQLNPETGSISRVRLSDPKIEWVDTTAFSGLNEYLYVEGLNPAEARRSGKASIRLKENGPLVASFLVESEAPGCRSLQREVRLVHGLDRVELINTLDKEMVRAKESVHFGFPFRIPDAIVRYDLGFGVVRPEANQLPGACRDYYSVQRWVDVSNQDYGVTVSVDEAPLIEIGGMRNEDPVAFPSKWKTRQEPSSTIFSYVMNNYWHTNYKADQEGKSVYHYAIRPHGLFNQAEAARFGIGQSQPLILRPVAKGEPEMEPLFTVSSPDVLVNGLRPLDRGKGWQVRLYNAAGSPQEVTLTPGVKVKSVGLIVPSGEVYPVDYNMLLPAYGMVTLKLEK
ncbi:MAG: glycoside hydrolase [Bacteroidia bacterium]|nr:glycoside hydrolase [Bacteroidia bacterium]